MAHPAQQDLVHGASAPDSVKPKAWLKVATSSWRVVLKRAGSSELTVGAPRRRAAPAGGGRGRGRSPGGVAGGANFGRTPLATRWATRVGSSARVRRGRCARRRGRAGPPRRSPGQRSRRRGGRCASRPAGPLEPGANGSGGLPASSPPRPRATTPSSLPFDGHPGHVVRVGGEDGGGADDVEDPGQVYPEVPLDPLPAREAGESRCRGGRPGAARGCWGRRSPRRSGRAAGPARPPARRRSARSRRRRRQRLTAT